ncbi:ISWI chromatin-remodeling complex ATPase ISW2 [Pseudozyma hubeiensis]|nr:ISWI chromatin-remodeling complex ATPase ISW2 [Pseudozyma hubeiensis]
MSISPLADAIPPASDTPTTDAPAAATAAPPPVTPKRGRPRKTASPKKVASPTKTKTEVSPTGDEASNAVAAPVSPSAAGHVKLNDALKKAAVAMKMRGMTTKAIAVSLNVNYKTVWNHIDKVVKAKARLGTQDGVVAQDMSESDKKECAISLKLAGWSTKDIAETLDINYKTIWNYLDKQQKAAGLPPVVHDPDM